VLIKGALIVPQKSSFIVERLGKYHRTLDAGFHILIPLWIGRHTNSSEGAGGGHSRPDLHNKDNVSVEVDGLITLRSRTRIRPPTASTTTSVRLAVGTDNPEVGHCKIDLDKTFEERDKINTEVIDAIDQAALSWGVKVLRYEIKDITPPVSVKEAMEAQMTAERQKRANIATSEGLRRA